MNIGKRQQGRLRAKSIIDCETDKNSIVKAIKKSFTKEFSQKIKETVSLYGEGEVSVKIKEVLKKISLLGITVKQFHDIKNMEEIK